MTGAQGLALLAIVLVSMLAGMALIGFGQTRQEKRKAAKSDKSGEEKIIKITRFIFITTQVAALGWVSVSYLIALYATLRLGQVFPVVELSQQAITTILGTSALKVVENIFEHNEGTIWGSSK